VLITRRDANDLKTMTDNDDQLRDRRLLVITDNAITAKLVGDAFEENNYEVLATDEIAKGHSVRDNSTPRFDPIDFLIIGSNM